MLSPSRRACARVEAGTVSRLTGRRLAGPCTRPQGRPVRTHLLLLALGLCAELILVEHELLAPPEELVARHDLATEVEEDAGDDGQGNAREDRDGEGGE